MARITKIQNEKWFSLTWKLQEKIKCKGRCLRKQWSNVCPSVWMKTNLKYKERLLVTQDILVWLGTLSKPHGFIACSVQKNRHKHRLQSTECIFLHRLVKLLNISSGLYCCHVNLLVQRSSSGKSYESRSVRWGNCQKNDTMGLSYYKGYVYISKQVPSVIRPAFLIA